MTYEFQIFRSGDWYIAGQQVFSSPDDAKIAAISMSMRNYAKVRYRKVGESEWKVVDESI